MNQHLRNARLKICEEYVRGGHSAALTAVAANSVWLTRFVVEGDLLWHPVFRTLLQVSVNLKLPLIFGRRVVRAAIYAGPNFYSEIAEAA